MPSAILRLVGGDNTHGVKDESVVDDYARGFRAILRAERECGWLPAKQKTVLVYVYAIASGDCGVANPEGTPLRWFPRATLRGL